MENPGNFGQFWEKTENPLDTGRDLAYYHTSKYL